MLTPDFPPGERAMVSPYLLITLTYGLGTLTTIHDLGGAYNLNLVLHTAIGQYVARIYRPWVTAERLQALQSLKYDLYTLNLPVILPCPTCTGTTYTTFEDRMVEMEPFLHMDRVNEALPSYLHAATMLGQLHNGLRRVGGKATIPAPHVANYAPPETLQAWILHVQQQLQHATHLQATQAQALCTTALILLETILGWWHNHKTRLPQQLIHGDYGLRNIAFYQGKIVALLDFDFVAQRERLFELAYTVFWMLYRLPLAPSPHTMWKHVQQFIEHYQKTSLLSLTDVEHALLPIAMARVPLYWIAEAAFLPNPVDVVLQYATHLALAQHLFNEQEVWLKL
ncbi:MAG: phosphotransferase [Chloroflexi bacterium AL-W]|nr:phosphotransferase [Chloroflexi bacterium AL-N1]NOK71672.1 phosphotransferase [Chloroflexi bacterium AL-N10]NOK79013.1 phosphotransferase [Chloroflexi bacterium AL-N5]NOK86447.1 phosphotransferase [Chloroflexi bacterium AL-W]NOK93413.1 phosphotransferase [Chloroflexi bacterium AL-N15]